VQNWRKLARVLKTETYAVYLACKHPLTPWPARLLGALVVAYALSPVDLLPDWIPGLGYVDDLVLIPLGVSLMLRLIPPSVMEECRAEAARRIGELKPKLWAAGAVIVAVWVVILVLAARWVAGLFG
jgi:uncharacterized membrane protein YkvA (DUF1232 family)